jgi:flavorubredoxin
MSIAASPAAAKAIARILASMLHSVRLDNPALRLIFSQSNRHHATLGMSPRTANDYNALTHRLAGRSQMTAKIDEIGDGIFRISVFVPQVLPPSGFTFNHFLLMDDEPLLFHCGKRKMFPLLADAVKKIMPIEKLRWATFGHFEADECGGMNEWLAAAPHCELMHGMTGVRTSLSDMADRAPRMLADGQIIEIGRKRVRYIDTPHVPHGWDAGVIYEENSKTLFVGDLFAHYGDPQPVTTAEIVSVAMKTNDSIYSTSLGPVTAPTIRKLAALNPQTLAVMHGSSFSGDGSAQLQGLADAYDERLLAAIAER